MFLGDLSLGEHYFSFGHGPRSLIENGCDIFENVRTVLQKADYVIANLEGPLSDHDHNNDRFECFAFNGNPSSADLLIKSNINVVSIANNHILQHGIEGMNRTVDMLQKKRIKVLGMNPEYNKDKVVIIEQDNQRIALIAASCIKDNFIKDQNLYTFFDKNKISKMITELRKECTAIILLLHWGNEGDLFATEDQKELAHLLIDSGVDLLIGHHPHVLFEIERLHNKLIAYSLGNFVFDLSWEKKFKKSIILDIQMNSLGALESVQLWPIKIVKNGIPILASGPLEMKEAQDFLNFHHCNAKLRFQQAKKFLFYLLFLWRGRTSLKIQYLRWKISSLL